MRSEELVIPTKASPFALVPTPEPSASGSGVERRHSGVTETCRYSARRGEGCGACDDEGGVCECRRRG